MNPKVRLVVLLMKSNLNRPLTLDDMCAVAKLSRSRLHNLFKTELGASPLQYHKSLRLERARELLEETFWKVESVRIEVGYRDHSHFFRDFRERFGMPPSRYRALRARPRLSERRSRYKKTVRSSTKQ